jgi:hypothetical protein
MGSDVTPASSTALATVDSKADDILVDTAEIGAAGAGLTAVPWNTAWDAEVQSEATDALNAYDPPTDTEMDAAFGALNDLSAAEVNAEVDTALADIHLDHLLATNYDPASKPGTATALFNELIESDSGVSRFTANALEQAPSGGGGGGDATAANQTTIINHLTDIKGATWASTDSLESIRDEGVALQSDVTAILADTAAMDTSAELRTLLTGGDNALPTASALATVDSEVGEILTDTGTTLPATLSGLATASALSTHDGKLDTVDDYLDTEIAAILGDTNELQTRFNNMIEADSSDWRFTTNALEQAPAGGGGGGGDATAANQTAILAALTAMQGTGFDTDDHSLVAIQNDISAVGGGAGSTPVNHDTGGTDELRAVDSSGSGIEAVSIIAYVTEDYEDDIFTIRGTTTTGADGRWVSNLMLDEDVPYTLVFYKPGAYGPATVSVTP